MCAAENVLRDLNAKCGVTRRENVTGCGKDVGRQKKSKDCCDYNGGTPAGGGEAAANGQGGGQANLDWRNSYGLYHPRYVRYNVRSVTHPDSMRVRGDLEVYVARRLVSLFSLVMLAALLASPALARSKVIAQKSTKVPMGSIYLAVRLHSGHSYHVDVTADGRRPFLGYGTEQLLGTANKRAFTTSSSLSLSGTTPRSFTVRQALSAQVKLNEWVLAVQIQLKAGKKMTVRIVDLGRK